jgi:hypothetical protein
MRVEIELLTGGSQEAVGGLFAQAHRRCLPHNGLATLRGRTRPARALRDSGSTGDSLIGAGANALQRVTRCSLRGNYGEQARSGRRGW